MTMRHRPLKLIATLAIATFTANTFAQPVFKHFSDYRDITPTKESSPAIFRTHYLAKQKVKDRAPDPLYKNNQWKLVMRRGIYLAQVDKAMSEIYQTLLGYSTDVDIVEENGDYYIARRKFNHFKKASEKGQYLIQLDGSNFTLKGYQLLDDGRLVKDNETKRLRGLASIAVLTRFFNETDAEDFNYGFQESDTEIKTIFYDNEHALSFSDEENQTDVENDLENKFGDKLINMAWYQQEKKQMLEKIATTDFSVFEKIIRKNITGNRLDEGKWMLAKILSDPTVMPDYDRNEARKQLDEINKLDVNDYGVEKIISELRTRHEQLKNSLH